MKFGIRVRGVEELRRKVANAAECAISGTMTRRGLSEAGRIVTRQQKLSAPVRRGRLLKRQLKKRLGRGMEIGKATKLSTVKVTRFRSHESGKGFIGPRKEIKPGQLKRSIGYRVIRKQGNFILKMGMNVGKKKAAGNFAPHAGIVGASKQLARYSNKFTSAVGPLRKYRGIMPRNRFIHDATNVAAVAAMAALDKAVKADTVRAFNLSLRASRSMEGVGS